MKTKNRIWISPLLLIVMGLLLILTYNCDGKDEEPNDKITDKDGNVYTSVTIGTQIWMAENLKTTKYNDGTAIPNITEDEAWDNLTSPAYCWYDNNISYKTPYGALYNYYAVKTGKLCPTGWHVPTDDEWVTLTDYVGGKDVAGIKLKEAGSAHWPSEYVSPSQTNEFGFTALPGGYRCPGESFIGLSNCCEFWSSTEESTEYVYGRDIYYALDDIQTNINDKEFGFSVRCLKD